MDFKGKNFSKDACLSDIFTKSFFQNIPQNSSVKTNFKYIKVFKKQFFFVRVTADERSVVPKIIHWKILSGLILFPILNFFLFRMHEWVIATEVKLDISIQIAAEHVLILKSKQRAKWRAQVTNINEYVSVNGAESGNLLQECLSFLVQHFNYS